MRRIQASLIVLIAVMACTAVSATPAFAEDEWLVEGSPVTGTVAVDFELVKPLLIEDMGVGTEVECTQANGAGSITTKGEGQINELQCTMAKLAKQGLCSNVMQVAATKLPWLTFIYLEEGMFREHITNESLAPSFSVECKTILGPNATDTCSGEFSWLLENNTAEKDVYAEADEATNVETEKKMSCSYNGGKGLLLVGSLFLIYTVSGLPLSVS
jgi:hypothetical protein